jgi:hypothetical protein
MVVGASRAQKLPAIGLKQLYDLAAVTFRFSSRVK